MIIYKIVGEAEWRRAEATGVFAGSEHDVRDGFIHFSTGVQAPETARKHFAGRDDLVLVAIDAARFGPELRWEVSRGGETFPHLYAPLPTAAALWVKTLALGPGGAHQFPREI